MFNFNLIQIIHIALLKQEKLKIIKRCRFAHTTYIFICVPLHASHGELASFLLLSTKLISQVHSRQLNLI